MLSLDAARQDLESKCPKVIWHPYFLFVQEAAYGLFTVLHAANKLYLRETYGAGGKIIYIIKLKTLKKNMNHAANNRLHDDDGYIDEALHEGNYARWGKFLRKTRLDELPSLWHLVGDGTMSLFGRRPLEKRERESHYPGQLEYFKALDISPSLCPIRWLFYYTGTIEERLQDYLQDAALYKETWGNPGSLSFFLWVLRKRVIHL